MNRPPEVIKVVSEPVFTDSSMRTAGSLRFWEHPELVAVL
jgi:hypothetical protein